MHDGYTVAAHALILLTALVTLASTIVNAMQSRRRHDEIKQSIAEVKNGNGRH